MRDILLILLHVAVMAAKLRGPGGVRAVIAENLLLKQQLIVLRRARGRAPNLTASDRLLRGFWSIFLSPGRIRRAAIALQPSTLLAFHRALVRRKYRRLFSSTPRPKKPGPKGPGEALIQAIVELKSRNARFGCPRIALIVSQTFGVDDLHLEWLARCQADGSTTFAKIALGPPRVDESTVRGAVNNLADFIGLTVRPRSTRHGRPARRGRQLGLARSLRKGKA
jgi:hypothetical protein